MRYNQNGEITAHSPVYGWLLLALSTLITIWSVWSMVVATELWQYASGASFLFFAGTLAWFGIKSVSPAKK
jgi:hypothetical protein